MNRRQKRGVALLVAALAAALGLTAVASAQARERCYGVARAGTADVSRCRAR
jgi:uncharacterized membrane protein